MPTQVLDNIRVLDFSRHLAGAGGTRVLANYGAEVLRVEWAAYRAFDFTRLMYPAEGIEGVNRGGMWNNKNIDKLSVTIDVKHPRGAELARRIAAISDVFCVNLTPDSMARVGLDYESLRRVRPDIIYLSISGWGHTGPRRNYRSYGASSMAHVGLAYVCGLRGRPPAGWQFAYVDHTPAFLSVSAVLIALHHRARTGRGQFIDMAQTQAGATLLPVHVLDYTVNRRRSQPPNGNHRRHPPAAPHNAYPCLGADTWCVIACYTGQEWQALIEAMGHPAWASEPGFATLEQRLRYQDELDTRIAQWTREFERYTLAHLLQARGVPAGVVQTPRDRVEWDPQLRRRGTFTILPHAEVGPRNYDTVAAKLSKAPYIPRGGPPLFGEHNNYALRQLLGLSQSEVDDLVASKLVGLGYEKGPRDGE